MDVLAKDMQTIEDGLFTLPYVTNEELHEMTQDLIKGAILNMIGNAQDLVSTLQQDRLNTSEGRFHVEENEFAGE